MAMGDGDDAETALLAPFGPNADALLKAIAGHVADPTLQVVAELEAGVNVGGHLAALQQIRDQGLLPCPFVFQPREVLELARYFEPDAADPADRHVCGLTHEQAHWTRAFAGAALLRALGDDEASLICDGCNFALIQMLESLRALNAGLEREALAALAWLIRRLAPYAFHAEDRAFAGVGMVAMATLGRAPVGQEALLDLARWVIAEEERAFDEWGRGVGRFPDHWLLRTSHFAEVRHRKWRALGAELATVSASGPAGEAVRDIGRRLASVPAS